MRMCDWSSDVGSSDRRRLFGVEVHQALTAEATEEQLRGAIELHQGEGEEERHERAMLRSILDLGDVWVEEIMIHRKDVLALDVEQPAAKIVEEVLASPFTRLPLWQDDPANIIGVLHTKKLLRHLQAAHARAHEKKKSP